MDGDRIEPGARARATAGSIRYSGALGGALAGALAASLVYGLGGRVLGEAPYAAVLLGIAAGCAARTAGGGPSIASGLVAATVSLVAVLVAKVLVGAPAGAEWFTYHSSVADLVFCYLANPLAALVAGAHDRTLLASARSPIERISSAPH